MVSNRPNILVLLTDQQRFDTIQKLGSAFSARTPHMDALAAEGVSFDQAFCTAPLCSASRATMMTGLFPWEAGVNGVLGPKDPPLSSSIPTIGKRMRQAGYQTVYHGKWHLGGTLQEHGFEVADECSHDESTRLMASRFWKDRDWLINDRPFFHVVSFLNPHDVYFHDPDHRVAGFQRPWKNIDQKESGFPSDAARVDWCEARWGAYFQFYAEQIERVDTEIGEALHQLRCSGFFGNTWIILASDHGEMAGEHDIPFKGPFVYEGVIRVPLVVVPPRPRFRGPKSGGDFTHLIAPGRRRQLCSLIDLLPTVLDLGQVAPDPALHGNSLLPSVQDPEAEAPHEYVFASWPNPGIRMIRSSDWKYVRHESGAEELYQISEDPDEVRNLSNDERFQPVAERLHAVLASHLARIRDPFPMSCVPE